MLPAAIAKHKRCRDCRVKWAQEMGLCRTCQSIRLRVTPQPSKRRRFTLLPPAQTESDLGALEANGQLCIIAHAFCRSCLVTFVRSPTNRAQSPFFCSDECQARFEFERKRLTLCLYPPCLELVIGTTRRYCSDTCQARYHLDRRTTLGATAGHGRQTADQRVQAHIESRQQARERIAENSRRPGPLPDDDRHRRGVPLPPTTPTPVRQSLLPSGVLLDFLFAARYGGQVTVVRQNHGQTFSDGVSGSSARSTVPRMRHGVPNSEV